MTGCGTCDSLRLDLAAERARADRLLKQLAAERPGACPGSCALAGELAQALRQLSDAHEREAELLKALRAWNEAAAAALDGHEEARP